MSNQRRNFVRNIALASVGASLYASDIIAGNSSLNYGKEANVLIQEFSSNERVIFERLLEEGYQISIKNQFLFNKSCTAYQVSKNSLLWGKEDKLLLIAGNNYFLLNESQQQAYNDFISSYMISAKENNMGSHIADFVTPCEILKTNKNGDFRFKNSQGNIFEIHTKLQKAYVKIVS